MSPIYPLRCKPERPGEWLTTPMHDFSCRCILSTIGMLTDAPPTAAGCCRSVNLQALRYVM